MLRLDEEKPFKLRLDKDHPPARKIPIGRRALTGVMQTLSGGSLAYESRLERDWYISLDFSPEVVSLHGQPFTLNYEGPQGRTRYTPDVKTEWLWPDGRTSVIVYEVKEREELQANWANLKPRFAAARRHCRENGWHFKVVNERHIRTAYQANAAFLTTFLLRDRAAMRPWIEQLLYTFRALGPITVQALLAAAYMSPENRLMAIPALWRLVGERRIGTDLNKPLTMSSTLWLVD